MMEENTKENGLIKSYMVLVGTNGRMGKNTRENISMIRSMDTVFIS